MDIAGARKVAPGAGDHIVRYVALPMPHEFFNQHHERVVDGEVFIVERVHPRFFGLVPRHFPRRNGYDVPRLRKRPSLRVIVRGDPERQRAAGGKAARAHIPAAILRDHPPVAFENHRIRFRDAVLGAERIKRKPHVAAGVPHQLSHHRQITLIRPDDHAAAKKVKDRAWTASDFLLRSGTESRSL